MPHYTPPTKAEVFYHAYLECALWSSTGDNGEPLDADYSIDDIAPESKQDAQLDCDAFCVANGDDMAGLDPAQCGHDFWLTRNGHGAGFWDRGYGPKGDRLTAACTPYGGSDLCVGDDGLVHLY